MRQYARVIRAENGGVTAVVKRESACGGNCGSCAGCRDTELVVHIPDGRGARPGDVVEISTGSGRLLAAGLMMYGFPLVLLLCGYAVANRLTGGNEGVASAVSLVCFVASFLIVKRVDRLVKKSGKLDAQITKIVEEGLGNGPSM